VLTVTADGVELRRYCLRDSDVALERAWAFLWSEVRGIFGFKRDAHVVDTICLAFELRDSTVEAREDMEGFAKLTEAIPKHFRDVDDSWWSVVAFPAFETNWTTIWQSGEGSNLGGHLTLPNKPLQPTSGADGSS
jgi:hypothetical protein